MRLAFLSLLLLTLCASAQERRRAQLQRPAGDSFVYYSTVFDGSDTVGKTTLTGAAPSKQGTFSCWIKFTGGDGNFQGLFTSLNPAKTVSPIYVFRSNGGELIFRLYNSAGTAKLNIYTIGTTFTTANGWFHLLFAYDLAATTYVVKTNGVSCPVDEIVAPADDTVQHESGQFYYVANYDAGQIAEVKLCELFFTTEYQPDATKFVASNHPKSLGANGSTPTGTQPLLYLSNPFGTFQNNLGSGGNFTATGTLGDGGADIP